MELTPEASIMNDKRYVILVFVQGYEIMGFSAIKFILLFGIICCFSHVSIMKDKVKCCLSCYNMV